MQDAAVLPRITLMLLASAGTLGLVGCAGTTDLSALANQNVKAATKVTEPNTGAAPLSAAALSTMQGGIPEAASTAVGSAPRSATSPASSNSPAPATAVPGATAPGASIEGTAVPGTAVPAGVGSSPTQTLVSTRTIVDAPAQPAPRPQSDPVAVPRPTATPVTLSKVPRTPVENRPTNQIMMVRTTAYTHTESDHLKYGRKSAAGNTLQYGSQVRSAAADWSKYPLGTRFKIEGLPYEYVVDDYGSALVGTETIDIYKPEKGTMNKWGVRNVPIRVIEWGSFEESRKILDERKHVRHADHVREMLNEIEEKAAKGQTGSVPVRRA